MMNEKAACRSNKAQFMTPKWNGQTFVMRLAFQELQPDPDLLDYE